ncbi:uncharacterized protein C2845_PM01G36730 [Panicum miliaceum]|uniref:Uncharacterized protein n=1 Tax=Panicum miliaceum TaxID=4540 RepID=A0A3L6TIQ8_PANMI|nr:uncharacterized protein C2845_PM01G36730 [Panicum miliaceum]
MATYNFDLAAGAHDKPKYFYFIKLQQDNGFLSPHLTYSLSLTLPAATPVVSVAAKNAALLAALLYLGDIAWRWSHPPPLSPPPDRAALEGNAARVDEVQVEAVDRKIDGEVGSARDNLAALLEQKQLALEGGLARLDARAEVNALAGLGRSRIDVRAASRRARCCALPCSAVLDFLGLLLFCTVEQGAYYNELLSLLKPCQLFEEQRRLREEQRKLRIEKATLVPQRKAFYEEHSIPLEEDERKKYNGSDFANADSGSNYDGFNGNVYDNNEAGNYGDNDQVCDGGEHYKYGYDERQVERGRDNYSNGERQGGCQGQPRMRHVYVRKVMVSSDAGTEGDEKPEENVVSTSAIAQKDANADNADAVLAFEGAAQDGLKNRQGADIGERTYFRKERLNGSEKRKKKNAKKTNDNELEKAKKQDSEVDGSKKQADKQPLEEKKTLVEYERMCEEKKSSETSKAEVRKVTVEEFKGLQMLEKKKLDVMKVTFPRQNLGFRPPRRVPYDQEVAVQNGNGAQTGGYNGGGNDAPRVDYSSRGRRDGYIKAASARSATPAPDEACAPASA